MVSTDRKAGSKQRRRSTRIQAKEKSTSPDSRTPSAATARSLTQWDDTEWKLFISTASKVSVWDGRTCTRIFTSTSEGIVIAKRAKDGSALAIADSQVVVLHKVEEGQPMSYRLKGSEGPCRLLQYSHDSKSLFFTDSIHNTVQTYNIPEGRVSDAGLPHPSPVTAFAVSADSNLILSCSENPPIVQLHNRLLGTTATIVPQASIKPVIICTFHPTRKHTFILAFKDGVVAAYDSTRLGRTKDQTSRRPKGNSQIANHIHKFEHLHDPSVSGNPDVTAVQFIPGYKAKAVSVGEDGRAFVLDFEQKDVQASWHVGAPITSLSIRAHEDYGWLGAVGTVHGMCLVYDSEGKKLCDRAVDSEGAKILGVEWISGEVKLPQLPENDKQVEKIPQLSAPEFKVEHVLAKGREKDRVRQNSLERVEKTNEHILKEKAKDCVLKEHSNLRQPSDKVFTPSSSHNEEPVKEKKAKPRQGSPPVKPEPSLKRVDSRPPKLPELHADGSTLLDGVDPYTADLMSLFSPVKKTSALTLSSSLPDRKPIKSPEVLDHKDTGGDRFDQRSALSAPQLWNEKIEAMLRPPTNDTSKSSTSSHPSIKDTPPSLPSPTIQSMLNAKAEKKKISIRPTSPPRSDRKDLGYKATPASDMSLLTEIRNIRAGNIPKRNGPGLAIFAPYMPSRPGAGKKAGDESVLRPELASTAKKAVAEVSQLFEKSVMQSSPGPIDGATGMLTSPPHKGSSDIEDLSDDGDIWLAAEAAASGSSSRKRKGSDSGGTRPSELARSSAKKTKASTHLQWDSSFVDHVQECSSPTRHANYTTFLDTTYTRAPRQDLDADSSPGPLSNLDESRYKLDRFPFETDLGHNRNSNGSNKVLSTEMNNMRNLFQQQFTFLQQEMTKEFRVQRKLLEGMKKDMASLRNDNDQVRRENERLKKELKKLRGE